MPLTKEDAPKNEAPAEPSTPAETRKAQNSAIDAAAGAPGPMRAAAEALPEKDEVQKAYKEAMLADDAQTEAKAKVKAVKASPNAAETPSGGALIKTAGIADDVKRGEEYARIKSAIRFGYVPATDDDLEVK
jgi:hypothetical protein